MYAENEFGNKQAFPFTGGDLHGSAKSWVADVDLARLDATATPRRLESGSGFERRAVYTVAGSFVKFLIDRYDMDKFRALYALTPLRPGERGGGGNPERWRQIFGKPLSTLQAEWRAVVNR